MPVEYARAYKVLVNGATFKFAPPPSNPTSTTTTYTAAQNVTVADPNGGNIRIGEGLNVTSVDPGHINAIDEVTVGHYTFVADVSASVHPSAATGIIIESDDGTYYFLTNTTVGGVSGAQFTLTSFTDAFCFMAGTLIRTPDGEVAVETLKRGDLVVTDDGGLAVVDWLGVQTISLAFADRMRVLPIRIKAGALGDTVPSRDLLVSPDHAILVRGALIHAGALVNGTSIVRETDVPATFTYYHVEVEDHALILAENTPAETFMDNVDRQAFDNWAEHEALYPNGKPITELPYPRAKSHRQVPLATRLMLAGRADTLLAAVQGCAAA